MMHLCSLCIKYELYVTECMYTNGANGHSHNFIVITNISISNKTNKIVINVLKTSRHFQYVNMLDRVFPGFITRNIQLKFRLIK